jgi:hypothetical protein
MRLGVFAFTVFVLLISRALIAGNHRKDYQYLSPLPNARYVSPSATIIVRFQGYSPFDLVDLSSCIQAEGKQSGYHAGQITIAADKKTVIFKPAIDFLPGETVSVTITPEFSSTTPANIEPLHYQFEVSQNEIRPQTQGMHELVQKSSLSGTQPLQQPTVGQAMIMDNGVSVPSDFPYVNITVNSDPDTDYIFIDNRGGGGKPYNVIFDNSGAPIWYSREPDERRDFKVQPNGWATMMIRDGYGGSGWGFIALDTNYEYVKTFRATNGYSTDEHELKVLPDGGYFLIGVRSLTVDMSQYVTGGRKNATVSESCIEEFTAKDELIFQWRGLDHFDIRDVELDDPTGSSMRFPHMNAIDLDDDGNIILSSRHISEVTKINRQTGEIIWRLGGAHNQFTFVNDELGGFKNQHAARALGNGHYTLFDNGDLHNPPVSRAVEYELDTTNMTATLVWEFRDKPDKYSYYMGNVQRLPNGNTLINWAIPNLPKLTEVRPDGTKAFEMNFVDQWESYRVHRCAWQGVAKTPYLIVEPQFNNVTLLFNKFGDREVDYYNIYGGFSHNPTALLDTSKLTLKRLTELTNNKQYYFRVTAVDKNGTESVYSNEVGATVNFIDPGQNSVPNGDFSQGKNFWTWEVTAPASANWNIENGVSHFNISNGGDQIYSVQLRQNGIPLVQGNKYVFEFDAWATASRIVEAKVGQDVSPFTNYSKIGLSSVSASPKHFSFPFTMEDPTDYNARVVFNTGTSDIDVYIDNVSLKTTTTSGIDENYSPSPAQFELEGNYPNPFNASTKIAFYLPQASQVVIKVYDIQGRFVQELINQQFEIGDHAIDFDASRLATGIYFYRFEAWTPDNSKPYSAIQKLLLIK